MKTDAPNILLVNPWIHDFAAYDFWAKPIGLLSLASILRCHGFNISYIDCLDRFHPKSLRVDPHARYGRGPYLKTEISKPKGLEKMPRKFSCYGIKENWFKEDLLSIPKPNLVLVTSLMTYWYTGLQQTISIIRKIFSNVPILLGGIYASLCYNHAVKHSGADKVEIGHGERYILELVSEYTGFPVKSKFNPDDLNTYPYPALELQREINYVPIITSRGCPFSCAYCASNFIDPVRMQRNPDIVVEEIRYWHEKYSVKNFIFYDDALLVDSKQHAVPLLEGIIRGKFDIFFHTPNALHIREISKHIAILMFRAGFKTVRLGLETANFEKRGKLDKKVAADEFIRSVSYLKEAGFRKKDIGAYLLAGLPGQSTGSIKNSIKIVRQCEITPILAYYSPIPHTALWKDAVASSRFDLEKDPIFTNNSIFPCQKKNFSWRSILDLKNPDEQKSG
ncbi:MAG: B12-binding domain-containing radical SAM protein [Deltaproteobacteria bacterium]|nr:MAG: B12-binding domain-containing radical SAM protein [Deltaproteobacteria bacterium]